MGVDARVYRAWPLGRVEAILRKEDRVLIKLGNKRLKGGVRAYRLAGVGKWHWLEQLVGEFGLGRGDYGRRCPECNTELDITEKEKIVERVPNEVLARYEEFKVCLGCGRVYWSGSQFRSLRQRVEQVLGQHCP